MLNCSVPKIQEQHNNKATTTSLNLNSGWYCGSGSMIFSDCGDGHGSWRSRKISNPSFLRSTVFLLSAPFFCSPSVGRSKMPKCSETGMKKSELRDPDPPNLTKYTDPDPPNLTEYKDPVTNPCWIYGAGSTLPYWTYGSGSTNPYWKYGPGSTNPYWIYGSGSTNPYWIYGSGSTKPYWIYGSGSRGKLTTDPKRCRASLPRGFARMFLLCCPVVCVPCSDPILRSSLDMTQLCAAINADLKGRFRIWWFLSWIVIFSIHSFSCNN